MSWPDLPDCVTTMKAQSGLTIRDTPSALGRNMGRIPAGMVVRVDKADFCLLYGAKYRYIRLVSWSNAAAPEPLYIVWEEITETGVKEWLTLHRDDCVETPEDDLNLNDLIDLRIAELNVVLPFLHDKLGTDALKAKLAPSALVAMQELIVGASTPDVPPVEPEPVPEIPPVETFPPEPPQDDEPPVVTPPPVTTRNTTPFEARGNRIYKDGNLWNKFIGVNHRGIAWYGVGDVLPHSNEGQIAAQLDFDKAIGVQVVRLYCAHHKHDVQFAIPRVKRILDMLKERGMYGICVMTDGAHSGFHVRDDVSARGVFGGGNERYSKAWITEQEYRIHYLPYVRTMVQAIANHPAIWALEVANEITTIDPIMTTPYLEAMLGFFRETVEVFREYSPNSMATDGAESAHQLFGYGNAYAGFNGARKLSALVDFRTLHSYQDEKAPGEALGTTREHLKEEFKIAGVPHVWEEMMGQSSDPTTNWMDKALHASAQAVVGWMLWNPCWNIGDNNDCDGLNPAKDGHNGARKHNYQGWVNAWANNLRLAT